MVLTDEVLARELKVKRWFIQPPFADNLPYYPKTKIKEPNNPPAENGDFYRQPGELGFRLIKRDDTRYEIWLRGNWSGEEGLSPWADFGQLTPNADGLPEGEVTVVDDGEEVTYKLAVTPLGPTGQQQSAEPDDPPYQITLFRKQPGKNNWSTMGHSQ